MNGNNDLSNSVSVQGADNGTFTINVTFSLSDLNKLAQSNLASSSLVSSKIELPKTVLPSVQQEPVKNVVIEEEEIEEIEEVEEIEDEDVEDVIAQINEVKLSKSVEEEIPPLISSISEKIEEAPLSRSVIEKEDLSASQVDPIALLKKARMNNAIERAGSQSAAKHESDPTLITKKPIVDEDELTGAKIKEIAEIMVRKSFGWDGLGNVLRKQLKNGQDLGTCRAIDKVLYTDLLAMRGVSSVEMVKQTIKNYKNLGGTYSSFIIALFDSGSHAYISLADKLSGSN